MGYVFEVSHNIIIDGVVHATCKDVKKGRQPGLRVMCIRRWLNRDAYPHTKRKVTCLECVAMGFD